MHRCYIEAVRWADNPIIPSSAEAHHMCHVLRVNPGDPVCIFDGQGGEAVAVWRSDPAVGMVLEVEARAEAAGRGLDIVLVQAVLKGSRMDLLVEKVTELGVARLVPVVTQRTIPRFDAAQARQKQVRWERIAVSAAKQCGTRWLPAISAPLPFEEGLALAGGGGGPVLLASLTEATAPLAEVLDRLRAVPPSGVTVVIGPEGDLTEAESRHALSTGAVPVSLGRLTLRAETAAIYAVSAVACLLRPV